MYTLIICWRGQFKIASYENEKNAREQYEASKRQKETLAAFVYYCGVITLAWGRMEKD